MLSSEQAQSLGLPNSNIFNTKMFKDELSLKLGSQTMDHGIESVFYVMLSQWTVV